MKKAAVIMGSDSDLPVVEKAFAVFEEYGVPYEVHVYSAHRTPVEARIFIFILLLVCSAAFAMRLHLFEPVLRHHYNPKTHADELVTPDDPAFQEEEQAEERQRAEHREEIREEIQRIHQHLHDDQ